MRMHKTGDKGDIAVARVTADLIEQGWMVLSPVASTSPFDLVAYRDGVFCKIQVKYRTAKNGRVEARPRRAIISRGKASYRPMSKGEVDVLCIFCPDNGECYYVDSAEMIRTVWLRLDGVKSRQKGRVASQYRKLVARHNPEVAGSSPVPATGRSACRSGS